MLGLDQHGWQYRSPPLDTPLTPPVRATTNVQQPSAQQGQRSWTDSRHAHWPASRSHWRKSQAVNACPRFVPNAVHAMRAEPLDSGCQHAAPSTRRDPRRSGGQGVAGSNPVSPTEQHDRITAGQTAFTKTRLAMALWDVRHLVPTLCCDPYCWCRRTSICRLVKWWFPGQADRAAPQERRRGRLDAGARPRPVAALLAA